MSAIFPIPVKLSATIITIALMMLMVSAFFEAESFWRIVKVVTICFVFAIDVELPVFGGSAEAEAVTIASRPVEITPT